MDAWSAWFCREWAVVVTRSASLKRLFESTVKNIDKNNCKLPVAVNDDNPPDTGHTTPPPLQRPKKPLKTTNKKNHTFSNKGGGVWLMA
uniref:Uncharacterized protein n=1 Tax=Strigamia maritima TaxID=126957 RepID=T1J6K0_STRMM